MHGGERGSVPSHGIITASVSRAMMLCMGSRPASTTVGLLYRAIPMLLLAHEERGVALDEDMLLTNMQGCASGLSPESIMQLVVNPALPADAKPLAIEDLLCEYTAVDDRGDMHVGSNRFRHTCRSKYAWQGVSMDVQTLSRPDIWYAIMTHALCRKYPDDMGYPESMADLGPNGLYSLAVQVSIHDPMTYVQSAGRLVYESGGRDHLLVPSGLSPVSGDTCIRALAHAIALKWSDPATASGVRST